MAISTTAAGILLDNYVNARISETTSTVRGIDSTNAYETALTTARTNLLAVLVNSTSPTYDATQAAAALDAYANAKVSQASNAGRLIETDGTSTLDTTLGTVRTALITALHSAP